MRSSQLQQFVRYTAWGLVDATPITQLADTVRLGWQGLMYESDSTKLYFVRNRWYDPVAARFISEDPLESANLYTFAQNDPVNGADPSSLRAMTAQEKAAEGPICIVINCNAVTIYDLGNRYSANSQEDQQEATWTRIIMSGGYGSGVTAGATIMIDMYRDDKTTGRDSFLAILAHELTHVWQNEDELPLGSTEGGLIGLMHLAGTEMFGSSFTYNYTLVPGEPFFMYSTEQQGQIVQDCYSGYNRAACSVPAEPFFTKLNYGQTNSFNYWVGCTDYWGSWTYSSGGSLRYSSTSVSINPEFKPGCASPVLW